MENKYFHETEQGGYYIVDFTVKGKLRYPEPNVIQLISNELKSKNYTDVILLAHGWNVGRTEQGSIHLPDEAVPVLEERKPKSVNALYVAVKWPSDYQKFFEGQLLETGGKFKDLVQQVLELIKKDDIAEGLENFRFGRSLSVEQPITVDEVAKKVEVQGESFLNNGNDDELPDELASNMARLANEVAKQSATTDEEAKSLSTVTAEKVKERYQEIRKRQPAERASRSFVLPAVAAVATGIQVIKSVKRAYDLSYTLFNIIFGTMEQRASIVGTKGVHGLLDEMMKAAPPKVRFHLFGHSLGAHVVMAAAIGTGDDLQRKIHTMMLPQGCVPRDALSDGGMYRAIVNGVKPIAGPILATVVYWDQALIVYDVWMPRPLGRFGFDDIEPMTLESKTVKDVDDDDREKMQKIVFKPGVCYNLKSKAVINDHTDVKDVEIMDLFWQAATIEL